MQAQLRAGRPLAAFKQVVEEEEALKERLGSVAPPRLDASSSATAAADQPADGQLSSCLPALPVEHLNGILSEVLPLALKEFRHVEMITACVVILELCGVSAEALKVDAAALRRICIPRNSAPHDEAENEASGGYNTVDSSGDLVQALCDTYKGEDGTISGQPHEATGGHLLVMLMSLRQQLVQATINQIEASIQPADKSQATDGGTPSEFVSQSREWSQSWALVRAFCRQHCLPLSDAYLKRLAGQNDWVEFLWEAQRDNLPYDDAYDLVLSEFTDIRLQRHLIIVFDSMRSSRISSPVSSPYRSLTLPPEVASSPQRTGDDLQSPRATVGDTLDAPELFTIVAASEHERFPGLALLARARSLRWPLLAVIAACFGDVSTENCLVIWLQTTTGVDITDSAWDGDDMAWASSSPSRGADHAGSTPDRLPQAVVKLCGEQYHAALLRGFELFLPGTSIVSFIRFIKASAQFQLVDAAAHLADFCQQQAAEQPTPLSNRYAVIAALGADAFLATTSSYFKRKFFLREMVAANVDLQFLRAGSNVHNKYQRMHLALELLEWHRDNKRLQNCLQEQGLDSMFQDNSAGKDVFAALTRPEAILDALILLKKWSDARQWADAYLQALLQQSESDASTSADDDTETAAVGKLLGADRIRAKATAAQADELVADCKRFFWELETERKEVWQQVHSLFLKHKQPSAHAAQYFLRQAQSLESKLPASEVLALVNLALDWGEGRALQTTLCCAPSVLQELRTRVALLSVRAKSDQQSGYTSPILVNLSCLPVGPSTPTATKPEGNSTHKPLPAEVKFAVTELLHRRDLQQAELLCSKLAKPPLGIAICQAAVKVATVGGSIALVDLKEEVASHLQRTLQLETMDVPREAAEVLQLLVESLPENSGGCSYCSSVLNNYRVAQLLQLSYTAVLQLPAIDVFERMIVHGDDHLPLAKDFLVGSAAAEDVTGIARVLASHYVYSLLNNTTVPTDDNSGDDVVRPERFELSKWAELCLDKEQLGHALLRLVLEQKELPAWCEVELIILAHRYYNQAACVDGVDVTMALAASRADAYISAGEFRPLARLGAGLADSRALRFVFHLLIQHEQLELLLSKQRPLAEVLAPDAIGSMRQLHMATLRALRHCRPDDHDSISMVHHRFNMEREVAEEFERRANLGSERWASDVGPVTSERCSDLLNTMQSYISAAQSYSAADCGRQAAASLARAALAGVQLRHPELRLIKMSTDTAQSAIHHQLSLYEALVVARAYDMLWTLDWAQPLYQQVVLESKQQYLQEYSNVMQLTQPVLLRLARAVRDATARGVTASAASTPSGLLLPRQGESSLPQPQPQAGSSSVLMSATSALLNRMRLAPTETSRLRQAFFPVLDSVPNLWLRIRIAREAGGFPEVEERCAQLLDLAPADAVVLEAL
eukprot:jgi/Chlat1/6253/Chrsp44S05856